MDSCERRVKWARRTRKAEGNADGLLGRGAKWRNCDHAEQMSRKKLEYEEVKQCTIQYDTCAAVPSPKTANELRQHRILETNHANARSASANQVKTIKNDKAQSIKRWTRTRFDRLEVNRSAEVQTGPFRISAVRARFISRRWFSLAQT